MPLKVLPEFKAFSALVGSGRQKEEMTVNIGVMEGPGVYFSGTINGLPLGLWLSLQEWESWLESTVSVVDTDCVHPDLLIGISHWALSALPRAFPQLTLSQDPPHPTSLTKQCATVCTYRVEQQTFHFVLLNWPVPFLMDTLADWSISDAEEYHDHKPEYQCGLVAGWCRLSLAQLQQIQVEDGLRLLAPAKLNEGHCWVWPEQGPPFYISLEEGETMTIKDINDDIDAFLELDGDTESFDLSSEEAPKNISLDELTQTLVMEIGRINLPIKELNQLSVGSTLDCKTGAYGEVRIRLNGQTVGSGSLLSCEGDLIVRIEQWLLDK